MNITHFNDLLQAARAQPTPQRLLLVFVQAELPEGSSAAQRARFEAGEGGALTPVMCVDKGPEELADFAELVAQASQFGAAWHMVLAGALGAAPGLSLSDADVQQALERLVDTVQQGRLDGLVPFNRQGEAVALQG